MSRFDVFISHSSATKDLARHLYYNLLSNSLFPWYDERNLEIGDDLSPIIESGIRDSQAFLLLYSHAAMQKKWVPMEMELAKERKLRDSTFRILIVRLDDEPFPDDFWGQFLFSAWKPIDVAGSIMSVVSAILGRPVAHTVSATSAINHIPVFLNETNTIAEHSRNFVLYYLSHIKNLLNGIVLTARDSELRDSLLKIGSLSVFELIPSHHGGFFQIEPGKFESIHANRMRIPPRLVFHGLPEDYEWEIISNNEISTVFVIRERSSGTPVGGPVPFVVEFDADF